MKKILPLSILAVACIWACKKSSSGQAPLTWTAGSSVYIVGADSGHVSYWKNGVKTELGNGFGNGITVVGSDVYVIGQTFLDGAYKGLLWKNGVLYRLTEYGFLYGIVVQ